MSAIINGLDALLLVLRPVFFVAALVLAAVCALDWAVRTRRINPFSGIARFIRSTVDPMLAPVERRVVRAGGVPSSAPWGALAAVVLGGIIVLSLLGFVRNQLVNVIVAASGGGRGIYRLVVGLVFAVLQLALIVRVLSSWIRVSPHSPWLRWAFVLSEPILRPLRRIVPTIGMIDITPIIAYFLLRLLASLLLGLA